MAASMNGARSDLDRLLDRPVAHIRWGLERIARMLEALGNPHLSYETLHVGGTNGKGSVCAVAAVLAAEERSVGLYTSPHLFRFAERIRINGAEAPADLLERCARLVEPLASEAGATYFEAATALAFLAFAEAGVELAVAEVGLGGRLDATNILEPKGCAIVTIGLDHCEYLGQSLSEVAFEKAGILKRGVPAVIGELPAEALPVLEERARETGVPLVRLGREACYANVRVDRTGTAFRYCSSTWPEGTDFKVPLPGRHQAHNATVALLLLEVTREMPDPRRVHGLLESVRWPGRVEAIRASGAEWILDAAHNPAGAASLAMTLRDLESRRPRVLVTAMLRRKAWPAILDRLCEETDAVVLTTAPSHPEGAAWDPDEARAYLEQRRSGRERGIAAPVVCKDLAAALERARELAGEGTVVVAGSCYLVGDARLALGVFEAAPHSGE